MKLIFWVFMLEQIVKKYVPFAGLYNRGGFDDKSRITLPPKLVDILQKRQNIEEKEKIVMYYRLHTIELIKHIELTDYFPEECVINFKHYKPLDLDKSGRILIPEDDLAEASIEKQQPV